MCAKRLLRSRLCCAWVLRVGLVSVLRGGLAFKDLRVRLRVMVTFKELRSVRLACDDLCADLCVNLACVDLRVRTCVWACVDLWVLHVYIL